MNAQDHYNLIIEPFLHPDRMLNDCDVCEKPASDLMVAAHICAAIDRLTTAVNWLSEALVWQASGGDTRPGPASGEPDETFQTGADAAHVGLPPESPDPDYLEGYVWWLCEFDARLADANAQG